MVAVIKLLGTWQTIGQGMKGRKRTSEMDCEVKEGEVQRNKKRDVNVELLNFR